MQRKRKKADPLRQHPLSSNAYIALRAERTQQKTSVAVVVPVRLFPKAVQRNRIRRQVREAVLHMADLPRSGWVIVFSVRSKEIPEGTDLQKTLFEVLKKSGIVSR